jgi:hypothetical protein
MAVDVLDEPRGIQRHRVEMRDGLTGAALETRV